MASETALTPFPHGRGPGHAFPGPPPPEPPVSSPPLPVAPPLAEATPPPFPPVAVPASTADPRLAHPKTNNVVARNAGKRATRISFGRIGAPCQVIPSRAQVGSGNRQFGCPQQQAKAMMLPSLGFLLGSGSAQLPTDGLPLWALLQKSFHPIMPSVRPCPHLGVHTCPMLAQ